MLMVNSLTHVYYIFKFELKYIYF